MGCLSHFLRTENGEGNNYEYNPALRCQKICVYTPARRGGMETERTPILKSSTEIQNTNWRDQVEGARYRVPEELAEAEEGEQIPEPEPRQLLIGDEEEIPNTPQGDTSQSTPWGMRCRSRSRSMRLRGRHAQRHHIHVGNEKCARTFFAQTF